LPRATKSALREKSRAWATYAALLQSTDQLLDSLRPLGARDYIDVESFMHVVTTRRSAHPKTSDRLVT
jgi:hypothetical protein